jgi:PIN domain nuclease of toxin-antitoxin system
MIQAVADTHTVIWYLFDDPRLSRKAKATIEQAIAKGDQIGFSSITMIEIIYLVEKGRINPETLDRLLTAVEEQDAPLVELPIDRGIARTMRSIPRDVVPDMPDRIIAATAQHYNTSLISRDEKIKISDIQTIW